jgi:hypothetical protein
MFEMTYALTESGIRGLLPYRSTFRLRAMGDKRGALAAQRVFRFKKSGESAAVWQRLIEAAAADLGCVAVWAVPGHEAGAVGHLQGLFGETIRRTRTTEPRKYGHAAPVDVASMEFPTPPASGGRVLLVDDVATTGATLTAIRDHLAGLGVEAVPLALGLNWRLLPKGFDVAALDAQWERAAAEAQAPATDRNERRHERRKASALIERRKCADPARRARLERDPDGWLKWYCAAAFPLPFGDVHKRIIDAAVRAIRTGAGMACAAPRGTGKTSVLWGVALWAILSGACRFPVVAGWSHGAARRMLKKWLSALADNARLQADYPEVTGPFESSTHSNRLRGVGWVDIGEPCGADVQQSSGTIVLPDGHGALGAVSISGNVRGLQIGLPDGSTIRPDVLLLDDPQDAATAASEPMTRKTIEKIEGDLFNVSGPDARLAIMAAVTVIAENDVAEHFLAHPDFEAIRVSQITAWPQGWADKASVVRALWDDWNKARVAGLAGHDDGKAARRFYREHKTELIEGMAVSWPARFDKKRKDPDALYAAMYDFFRLGDRAFLAERQNAPLKSGEASVFELPQAHVARRVNGLARRVAPDNAVAVVGFADINMDGIRWAIAAATNTRALSVLDYGIFPGHGRPLIGAGESEAPAIMRGLSGLDTALGQSSITKGAARMSIDCFLLDCGGAWMQTVFDWLNAGGRQSGIPWLASRGWGSRNYRPGRQVIGRPGDGWHLAGWPGKGKVLVHDADAWRMRQQKGWLLPIGAPDSIAFFGSDNERHELFADGVSCERLTAYAETNAGPLYRWQITPGFRNDWGDVATGLFVAASRLGLSPTTNEAGAVRRGYPARRRATGVTVIQI